MKHTFYAHLTATLSFTDEEFDLLFKAAEHHYSHDCVSLTKQGGILFGERNFRRCFNEENKSSADMVGMDCTQRQLGLLMKSLEMHLFDQRYQDLSAVIYSIAMELQSKETKANSFLDLLK